MKKINESYFGWLDTVAQKQWRFAEGTILALQSDFKDADKCLRIELGRRKGDPELEAKLINQVWVNKYFNSPQPDWLKTFEALKGAITLLEQTDEP